MKTPIKSTILGILIIIIFLLGSVWGISSIKALPSQQPKPSPTPEILENGQYRYTDAQAGYSFTYAPGTLSITASKDKGEKYDHLSIQFKEIKGYGYQGMVLYVLPNPKKLTTEDFLLTEFTGKWKKQSPPTNLTKSDLGERFDIGGYTAIKTSLPNYLEIESAPYFVYVAYGNEIIGTGPLYGLMNATELAPETEKVFLEVLQTLTFLP
ncbi:MAG: hypothetical protein HZB19_21135 [Chloroflexi bacterium]|nr:hypothetical protein [Chloroflexota bacterium]